MIYWETHVEIVCLLHSQFADARNNYYDEDDDDDGGDGDYEDDAATQRMRIALADGPTVNGAARALRQDQKPSQSWAEQTANYESEAAKGEVLFCSQFDRTQSKAKGSPCPSSCPKPTLRPPPATLLSSYPPTPRMRHKATNAAETGNWNVRERKKKKMKRCNRMRKMKMAKRKTQRSA